ncbi:MAG TPA: hypothetical protein PKI73_02495 [Petrotogaceae bacterium]|nr:hypothetical protein [Petrotogaceae bacterium]
MKFYFIFFTPKSNYYSLSEYMLKDYETVIARDTLNQIYELPNVSLDYIGYFIAQEKNFELCGIRRYLKPDFRAKKFFKAYFTDIISDDIRELYGEYIELISDYVGLKRTVESFNNLISEKNIMSDYDNWLEGLIKNVPSTYKEGVAQKISKFANIYMIKVYEKLFNKNILLLKTYSSEISYKIMETSLIQNIAEG